jgi:hypothetical protein
MFLRNVGTLNNLHYLTSQNLVLFIITAVRKSDLIEELLSLVIGGAMGKAMIMNAISFFCLSSIFMYASLTMDIKQMIIWKTVMGIAAVIGTFRLYSLCNAASNVTYSVRLA